VAVFERMPTLGRKFLMAGRGGLNLTHSEDFERFVDRYGAASARLRPMLDAFTPADLVNWAEGLGQATFVGSSGRVFPRALKASPLLRAWIARLEEQGVALNLRSTWTGWNAAGDLTFETPDGPRRCGRAPRSWPWAAPVGPGSARTAPGRRGWRREARPWRRFGRPMSGSPWPGRRCSASGSPERP
jgi:hypothetical protein